MQIEILELAIFAVILGSLGILSLAHLLDIRTSDERERKTAIYGSLVFSFLTVYFAANTIGAPLNLIVVLYATALTFIPVWVISLTKPNWFDSWKYLFTILFLILWTTYVVTRLFTTLILSLYFATIVIGIAVVVLLISLPSDKKALVLTLGLVAFYFDRAWTFSDVVVTAVLLVLGPLLILVWYLINKRS